MASPAGFPVWARGVRRYLHPRIMMVLLLGVSSGLPLLLIMGTLGAWLQERGIDKAAVGAFALVGLPYSFNFVWAPLMDNLSVPWLTARLGKRRSWMLLTQVSLAGCLYALSCTSPQEDLPLFALLAVAVAFLSASQDVVVDAFRTEYVTPEQYGEAAAVAVFGYRVGMLIAGAGALMLAEYIPWENVYRVMAACLLPAMMVTLLVKEPMHTAREIAAGTVKDWVRHAVLEPFVAFAQKHKEWVLLLAFVACYRIPDGFIAFMSTPFLLESGFSKTDIATVGKIWGFAATTLAMILAGAMIGRFGLWRSLLWFGIAQMITNLAYMAVSVYGASMATLIFAITCDNLAGGAVMAAGVALIMRLTDQRYTATQYALLSSLASLASKLLGGSAGWIAGAAGWEAMFATSALLGIPSILLLMYMRQHPAVQLRRDDVGEKIT